MDFSSFSPALVIVTVVGLAMAPFVAVMVTSFTKIVVVLSLLRNALGLQQVPPNVVINGLAIILSLYVMNPVTQATYTSVTAKVQEAPQRTMDVNRMMDLVESGKEPLRDFLLKHSSEGERAFFMKSAQRLLPPDQQSTLTPTDYMVVVPAFTVSELTAAFRIGFLIFLPFLIIDLVVSNILLAMGMMMLSPTTVSLPFKLLLFVFLDGWAKLVHGLVLTYG
jgi:type III secretion protein R